MKNITSIDTISLIACDERSSRQVEKATARMGITCHTMASYQGEQTDLLLIDVQHYFESLEPLRTVSERVPIVGLLTHGSPTEVERAADIGALSVVCKPIHQSGLYSAFYMAKTLKASYSQLNQKLETLQTRHRLRHTVIDAVIRLMTEYGVESESAYQLLQRYSMRRNVPLEQVCLELTQGSVTYQRLKAGSE